jgi:hypothetical protein
MTATTTLQAPTGQPNYSQQTQNSTYTAINGVISGVAVGTDVTDLLKGGCALIPSPENAPVLPWVKGRFYGLPPGATLEPLLTVTGTLYAYPIYVPSPISIATLNLSVTTGQTGGAAHLGIYADNAGYPGALVYDSGAVTGLTGTAVSTTTPATPPTLTPGWYWISTIFTASSTFPSVEAVKTLYTGTISNELGYDTAAHALVASGEAVTGISVAGTYGALPATFPASATLTLNADTPAVVLGV